MMHSEYAASEAERLIRDHGYDRHSPAVTPREVANRYNTAQFRSARPSSLGQGTERELSGIDPMLTMSVIDGARAELAAGHPLLDVETVEAAELALTAGERDPDSRAAALAELAYMEPREIQRLALAADVSPAERRELAKRGWALKDGSYPIKHAGRGPGSLHSAAVLAASGHGDVAAARALIKKAAGHFGVDLHSLPGFSQDDEDLKERAQRDRKRKGQHRHGHPTNDDDYGEDTGGPSGQGEGGSMAATSRALMRRSDGSLTTIALTGSQQAELGLAADGDDDGPGAYYVDLAAREFGPFAQRDREAAAAPDSRVGSPPFRVHDVGSSGDGSSVSNVGAEVARYLRQAAGLSREKPSGSSASYPPGSPAARRRAEERELAGGRGQSWR